MAASGQRRKRPRGSIDQLPSGAFRVRVYAGVDPLTNRQHYLTEVIEPGPKAAALAEKARTRLLNQVDERRHPRTNATLARLLERHLSMVRVAPSTLKGYRAYAEKHILPLIGGRKAGELDADVLDSFYAELRRCQEHCDDSLASIIGRGLITCAMSMRAHRAGRPTRRARPAVAGARHTSADRWPTPPFGRSTTC